MIKITGLLGVLEKGVETFMATRSDPWPDGVLHFKLSAIKGWSLKPFGKEWLLEAERPGLIFRALGMISQHGLPKEGFAEVNRFSSLGVSIDVSQNNQCMNVETAKDILLSAAAMGYSFALLYSEDAYPVAGYPYFGYMRGAYTAQELKKLDCFAAALGIELIPCLQTLAHLSNPLRWNAFASMREDKSTLLPDEEETYAFIEAVISSAASIFTSHRLHIGQDEAWSLGAGEYLNRHGYHPKWEIMGRHLARVTAIAQKYGFHPMMWSDMFFRMGAGNNGIKEEYALPPEGAMPTVVQKSVPAKTRLVYWEYKRTTEEIRKRITLHRQLSDQLTIAGHVRLNRSLAANYSMTFHTARELFAACDDGSIHEMLVTVWGDDAPESCIYSALLGMQLYAEYNFSPVFNQRELAGRFAACTGGNFDVFYALTYFDEIPQVHGVAGNLGAHNPSKWLLWQNPMLGLFDENAQGIDWAEHYCNLAQKLAAHCQGKYGWMFTYYEKAAQALALKAPLGLIITDAYRTKNTNKVVEIIETLLPQTRKAAIEMRIAHRDVWFRVYKPEGWDVFDVRYGALIAQLDTAAYRLKAWLHGDTDTLDELERQRLPYNGQAGLVMESHYTNIISAGNV